MTDTNLYSTLKLNKKNVSETQNEKEFRAKEFLRCRSNPLYFIYNYAYIQETGSMLKMNEENVHFKMSRVIRILHRHHRAVLMASRQLGNVINTYA